MSNAANYYALVEFIGCRQQEVSVISAGQTKEWTDFKGLEILVNCEVHVLDARGKSGGKEYPAKVLACSSNRPNLVALMETYIKTRLLTSPSNSKRPHIPKTFLSSDESEDNDKLQEAKRNTTKSKLKRKDTAHAKAAKACWTYLREKVAEQNATIKHLNAELKTVTRQRDILIEFVLAYSKTAGWKPCEPSILISAMGKRLNEIRTTAVATANEHAI